MQSPPYLDLIISFESDKLCHFYLFVNIILQFFQLYHQKPQLVNVNTPFRQFILSVITI